MSAAPIAIRSGFVFAAFGTRTIRTPFSNRAAMFAESTKAIALTLFDSQENLKKSEDLGYYLEQIAKFKPHLTGL